MAIRYSGGTNVSSTFVGDGTKQSLINGIETILLSAGFTTVSGSGTTNLLMQSAVTPQSHQMRFRFKAATTNVILSIENVSGSIVGGNSTVLGVPIKVTGNTGKTFRIIANKYQFCIIVVGEPDVAGEFAFGCVPWTPSFVSATDIGFVVGNTDSDSLGGPWDCWRRAIGFTAQTFGASYPFQTVFDTTLLQDNDRTTSILRRPIFVTPVFSTFISQAAVLNGFPTLPIHWPGLQVSTTDAILAWQITITSEIMLRCQLWDALLILDAINNEALFTFDSHTWINITNNAFAGDVDGARGSLVLVTA